MIVARARVTGPEIAVIVKSREPKVLRNVAPYLRWVTRGGGRPVVVSLRQRLPASAAGVLLLGGEDVAPARYGEADTVQVGVGDNREQAAAMVMAGIPTEPVGNRVVEAIKDNDLYIFTHTEFRAAVQMRFANIMAAFDKSETSKALSGLPKREMTIPPRAQQ